PEAPAVAPAPAPQPPVDPLTVRPQAPAQLVIALGGNVGGVVPSLRTAVNTLRQTDGITVTTVAPLARTAAVVSDGVEQPDYLNTVVLATTTLSPREVLAVCQGLETAAGRVRTRPQGPRTLDADIITYEGVTSTDPELTLPHPRAAQRAFVLAPWAQADPFAEIGDQSVAALAESAPDRDGVRWLALDWLDSDHLPALPTGQYVAPPEPEAEPEP
ncbi:2-amino-4-hydroxy-6-hydroxymethyldihydropteridine diphosphokinase, partial [Actinomyces succiniciruminis]